MNVKLLLKKLKNNYFIISLNILINNIMKKVIKKYDGRYIVEEHYHVDNNNIKQGLSIEYYESSDIMPENVHGKFNYVDGYKQGKGFLFINNYLWQEQFYDNGYLCGNHLFYDLTDNKKISQKITYKKGNGDDEFIGYNENGNIIITFHIDKDRLKCGENIEYDDNHNILTKTIFQNGEMIERQVYTNNKISVINKYDKNKKNGYEIIYDTNGYNMICMSNYVNGIKNGDELFFINGKYVTELKIYNNGLVEKIIEYFYPTNNIKSIYSFNNNKLNGKAVTYYDNGIKHYEKEYKDNRLNGEFIEYNFTGDIIEHYLYQNGKILKMYHETNFMRFIKYGSSDLYDMSLDQLISVNMLYMDDKLIFLHDNFKFNLTEIITNDITNGTEIDCDMCNGTDKLIMLPCLHRYHMKCLVYSFIKSDQFDIQYCPLCKKEINWSECVNIIVDDKN